MYIEVIITVAIIVQNRQSLWPDILDSKVHITNNSTNVILSFFVPLIADAVTVISGTAAAFEFVAVEVVMLGN